MTPNKGFLDFLKKNSVVFLGNNLKGKLILFYLMLSIFHHQSLIWQNSGSQVMIQNAVDQSNSRIF